MPMLSKVIPALTVHSWGGFGSQLFTALVVIRLKKRFPRRRIRVILHTAGITRRENEFDFHKLGIHFSQVDDFPTVDKQDAKQTSASLKCFKLKTFLKTSIVNTLDYLHIVKRANNDISLDLIKVWTISLRGHYTQLTFDKDSIISLFEILFIEKLYPDAFPYSLAIHYRLGDLLKVKRHSLISPKRIEGLLSKLNLGEVNGIILSDSPRDELFDYISGSNELAGFTLASLDHITTLAICIGAKTFIGTGAKLSVWCAIFRHFILGKESFLPEELKWMSDSGLNSNWY